MTSFLRKVTIIIAAAIMALSASASIKDLPVKTVNGKRYYYYEVQPKETVYSLCRRFEISRDEMIALNPSVADGLKAGQTLLFPVDGVSSAAQRHQSNYMVQKDETGYGISRKFNMTLEEFYSLNPSAKDGLKAGQYVVVYTSDAPAQAENNSKSRHDSNPSAGNTYEIAPGETLFHIAQVNGLTLKELLDANPSLNPDSYAAGEIIVIPGKTSVSGSHPTADNTTIPHDDDPGFFNPELTESADTLTVAIAMPFNAGAAADTRSQQATEFLRGFVLAMDSLSKRIPPVRLILIDTKTTETDAKRALSNKSLKDAKLIIAANNPAILPLFSIFAEKRNCFAINLFDVKDESYLTNRYMMNANVPHDEMYRKAIDHYLSRYRDVTPVFIKRKGGKEDKAEFVTLFKQALDKSEKKYHVIEYVDKLSDITLAKLPEGSVYAFIPNSSNAAEFQTFIDAINSFRESRPDQISPSLWGYPEWIILRGENLKKMHNANTMIFSRFYAVENDYETDRLQKKFEKYYGTRISDKAPKSGVLGFDTGMYVLKALAANNGDFSKFTPSYEGIQNAFNFKKAASEGGLINNEMFIINFAPGEFISKYGI